MSGIRITVKNGRLVLDEPTALPEGTVLDLVLDDDGDDLDEAERACLHAAISRAWQSAKDGKLRPAESLLDEMRGA